MEKIHFIIHSLNLGSVNPKEGLTNRGLFLLYFRRYYYEYLRMGKERTQAGS
nr:MAG TPA: hypothetical protein [Caudoviricetes sp.]